MKQKLVTMYLIGVGLAIGLTLFMASAPGTAVTASGGSSAVALLTSQAVQDPVSLRCDIKIPGGLAQCGSQASSCKNCHEVKGEDSVNAKGDWHVSHAFGDFCEFCHGGNVQATDEAAAHQGMVRPLGDVKTNCASCHAADYEAKAETYAKALGVTIGADAGGSTPPPADSSAQSNASTQPAQPAAPQPAPAATPTFNEITDYVAQYRAEHPKPLSAGTILISSMLVLTVVGGGSFMYWNEKRLRLMPHPAASRTTTGAADERSQEMARLLPILEKLDAGTLRALRTILTKRS
jgi:hypothetical protein